MKTINDVLNTMTEEEREEHKELIKECSKREEQLNQTKQKTQENILRFLKVSNKLIQDVNTILIVSKQMSNYIQNERIKNIPDEHFFKV
jgi:hypothetical protein